MSVAAPSDDRRQVTDRRSADRRRAYTDRRRGLPDPRTVPVERRAPDRDRRLVEDRRRTDRRHRGLRGLRGLQGLRDQRAPRRSAATLAQPDTAPRTLTLGLTAVAVLGVALRFVGLDRQSYWGDELFSVTESAAKRAVMDVVALREIHPPLYAYLLHGWIRVGPGLGTQITWTHLLSALCGALAVAVAWWGLRRVAVSPVARGLAVAATATSGAGVVYAQETRSYALLLLACSGLVAWTLRLLVPAPSGREGTRRDAAGWALWALLASATHLFGLVLLLGCLAVLLVRATGARLRGALVGLAVLGSAPQLAWVLWGRSRPGFAAGTTWIQAPDLTDLREFATTAFAAGDLVPRPDAFAWTAPWGVLAVVVLAVVAFAQRRFGRPPEVPDGGARRDESGGEHRDPQVAVLLLALAGLVVAATFLGSRAVHLWTGRNLLVVQPALLWGTVIGLGALPRGRRARTLVQVALVGLLAVQLVVVGVGVRAPYKTDFRGLVAYLEGVRAEKPDATFVIDGRSAPEPWLYAAGRPLSDGKVLFARARYYPHSRTDLLAQRPGPGTTVVVFYPGVSGTYDDQDVAAMTRQYLAAVGPAAGCSPVPVYGLVVVRCDQR